MNTSYRARHPHRSDSLLGSRTAHTELSQCTHSLRFTLHTVHCGAPHAIRALFSLWRVHRGVCMVCAAGTSTRGSAAASRGPTAVRTPKATSSWPCARRRSNAWCTASARCPKAPAAPRMGNARGPDSARESRGAGWGRRLQRRDFDASDFYCDLTLGLRLASGLATEMCDGVPRRARKHPDV
jgi:hypothetical protein